MNTKPVILHVLICVVLLGCVAADSDNVADIRTTVEALFRRVYSLQIKKDTPFKPPMFWEKHKGMYESDVKFCFHGAEDLFLLRDTFKVYDDNMFATAWITSCLLETFRYGNGPKPSEEQITSAILAIKEYHDKNVDYANSLMTFWPQKYNATSAAWESYPINLHKFFALAMSLNATELEKLFDKLGFKDLEKIVETLFNPQYLNGYLHAFLIPPDFDDTYVNLGIGSLLAEMKDDFPASHAQWMSQNTNLTSIYDALKKYAYRPLSANKAVNTIDCRAYFYLRYFLEDAVKNRQDVALVPTWVQDLNEVKKWGPRGVDMPLNVNNVDVTVAANGVFGTTSGILNGLLDASILDDPEIRQIYLNTTSLISYVIQTNFSSRQDLALFYYPSEFEFYWFVARTFGELQRRLRMGPLPHPVLETVRENLGKVLYDHMTNVVLNATQTDPSDNSAYFDDFLGDGDLDFFTNRTKVRGEDRLFTTAMAMNALLSTWTVFDDKTKTLVWEAETPLEVIVTVQRSANFLNKHIFGFRYKPWNAFFSGSVKGETTWPNYPINRWNMSSNAQPMYILGFQGVVSENEYQTLLKRKCLGKKTPIDFHGYNHSPDYWPFWCSESYTYVTSMLALAKFTNTVEKSNQTVK